MIKLNINERLDSCLMESTNPETIASAVISEFTVIELERVLSILIDTYIKTPSLLNQFWQRYSDACPLEAVEAEQQEKEWFKWIHTTIMAREGKAVAE